MKKTILFCLAVCSAVVFLSSCEKECIHEYLTSKTVSPTCDTEGYTANTCVECNVEFKTNYVPPKGHSITESVFPPTCSDQGYTVYSCPCGYVYTADHLPPIGHNYNEEKFDVTCTSAGYTEYTCTVCDHSYKGDFVSALGHSIESALSRPTKESSGYTEHKCSICEYSYKDSFVFYTDVYGSAHVKNSDVLAQGIDVSKHQHSYNGSSYSPLDWNAIKSAGVDFAILKAGSGKGKDPVFEMNYSGAKAVDMPIGAYFYSYATTEKELDTEIALLLEWLDGKRFEYPIYFDIEEPSLAVPENKEMLTRFCMKFITVLRDNGYYGALYTNQKWLTEYLMADTLFAFCDIWYSRYPNMTQISLKNVYTWNFEKYGEQLGMWQYSCRGVIDGSKIKDGQTVDFNYAYKDYPTIIKKYGLNGFEFDPTV